MFGGWFSRAKPVEESKEEPEPIAIEGTASSVLENLSAAWTPEEKARFYAAIGYDEEKGMICLSHEYKLMKKN